MQPYHHPAGSLWCQFRDSFVNALSKVDNQVLADAWTRQSHRTSFYRELVLPQVSRDLGLDVGSELFKVDFVMKTRSSSAEPVPVIFIESENVAITAGDEVRKLSVLAVPLRVLITVGEWSDHFPNSGLRKDLLPEWQAILRAHSEVWPHPGWLGILVGELGADEHLRFYALALGPDGEVRDAEEMKFDRYVGRSFNNT